MYGRKLIFAKVFSMLGILGQGLGKLKRLEAPSSIYNMKSGKIRREAAGIFGGQGPGSKRGASNGEP